MSFRAKRSARLDRSARGGSILTFLIKALVNMLLGIGLSSNAVEAAELTAESPLEPAVYSRKVGSVEILQVRPDIYMLNAAGTNVVVETGPQGTVVVDTGPSAACDSILAAVSSLAKGPVRYLINTSADDERFGCNASLAKTGYAFASGPLERAAPVIAHKNALFQMLAMPGRSFSAEALPSETFTRPVRDFYINGQGVQVIFAPEAHTGGDVLVFFRRSDVVVAGSVFDPTSFPNIDVERGGSIQGEIAVLNRLLDELAIAATPRWQEPGGTLVIPGRGPLCDKVDVLNYRNMVVVIRDRIQHLISQGKTLSEIQRADPTQGYSARYGADSEQIARFVEATYRSLKARKRVQR